MTPSPAWRTSAWARRAGRAPDVSMAPGRPKEMTAPGLLRPETREADADEEATITAVCPGLGIDPDATGPHRRPTLGAGGRLRTGHATDPTLRNASSGGGLSAIRAHLIATGRVDGSPDPASTPPPSPTRRRSATSPRSLRPPPDLATPLGPAGSARRPARQRRPTGLRRQTLRRRGAARLAPVRPPGRPNLPVMLSFFCAGVAAALPGGAVLTRLEAGPR